MVFPRAPKSYAQYERDARIARRLMRDLRGTGLDVEWFDKRDPHGLRLHPANLQCGHVWLLCRSTSYSDNSGVDRVFLKANPSAKLWRPCDDLGVLERYLKFCTGWNPFDKR